jgi:small-conductance mechanosensitive channel
LSTKVTAAKVVIVVFVALLAAAVIWSFGRLGFIPAGIAPSAFYSVIVLLGGIWLTNILSGALVRTLRSTLGNRAYTASNVFRFFGYIIVVLAAVGVYGVSAEVILAGGAFSGLVVGLGAQPLLGNFFAGVVILFTGAVRAGEEVTIVSSSVPFQPTLGVGYKFFSPDNVDMGYKGRTVEVGMLYSTMITDTGLLLKIPNSVILNAAIVEPASANAPNRQFQVRYEFSVGFDPEEVVEKVKDALKNDPHVRRVIVNEQSNQQYYIIIIECTISMGEDWKNLKSDILRKVIAVHRSMLSKEKETNDHALNP